MAYHGRFTKKRQDEKTRVTRMHLTREKQSPQHKAVPGSHKYKNSNNRELILPNWIHYNYGWCIVKDMHEKSMIIQNHRGHNWQGPNDYIKTNINFPKGKSKKYSYPSSSIIFSERREISKKIFSFSAIDVTRFRSVQIFRMQFLFVNTK